MTTTHHAPVPRRPRRQLPAPEVPARRARAVRRQGRDHRRAAARGRGPARSPRSCKFQEDVGLQSITDGEFRRTYFHIDFLEQLGGVKTDIPVTIKQARRHRGAGAAGDARDRQGAPRQGHPARRLRVPEEPGRAGHDAQGDDPLADHAALPRRARRHQPRGLPRARPGFYDDVAEAYGDELQSLADAGCTLRADGRHQPRLPVRREDARGGAPARRRSRTSCRTATPAFINKVVAHKPAGMTLAMHLCRGNFKSTHAAAGNYEPVAEALLSRDEPRRLLPRVRRRALAATSARCASCPRARSSCSAWSPPSSASWRARTTLKRRIDEAAKYVPLEQLCLSPQCGFSQHRARQRHRGGGAARRSCGWWSRRRRRSGAE